MQLETFHESLEKKRGQTAYRWITAAVILLALSLLSKAGFFDFLIPGDKAVTKQAFATMVQEVEEGEGVKSAITAFCQGVLDGAQIPY